ncbi:MAG: hypothetical protein R3C14_19815 [Caldilineaceae bacterium]
MLIKQFSTIILVGSLLLTGCASSAATPQRNLSQPPQPLVNSGERPNLPARAGNLPQGGDNMGRATLAPQLPHGDLQRGNGQRDNTQRELLAGNPATNLEQLAPIPDYDAARMIATFAQEQLTIQPTVIRAQGGSGNLTLPPAITEQINGSVALAGQVSAGVITVGSYRGAAQVAVGSGAISGDLTADISSAALGAYALLMTDVATPADVSNALSLLVQTYPALAKLDLQPESSGQGYAFRAVTTIPGVDWQTKQATMVAQVVMAGVSGQGRATLVWVVVGNGAFAMAL